MQNKFIIVILVLLTLLLFSCEPNEPYYQFVIGKGTYEPYISDLFENDAKDNWYITYQSSIFKGVNYLVDQRGTKDENDLLYFVSTENESVEYRFEVKKGYLLVYMDLEDDIIKQYAFTMIKDKEWKAYRYHGSDDYYHIWLIDYTRLNGYEYLSQSLEKPYFLANSQIYFLEYTSFFFSDRTYALTQVILCFNDDKIKARPDDVKITLCINDKEETAISAFNYAFIYKEQSNHVEAINGLICKAYIDEEIIVTIKDTISFTIDYSYSDDEYLNQAIITIPLNIIRSAKSL